MTTRRPMADHHDVMRNLFSIKDIPLNRQENRYPNYCISWSKHIRTFNGEKYQIFCCCGGDKAVVVGVLLVEHQQNNPETAGWRKFSTFVDHDLNESYRACTFGGRSSSNSKAELLILGGAVGVIRLVDIEKRCLVDSLNGHEPGMINDLKVSPTNESFLLSAATDESIRLWNLTVRTCVAVFGGRHGHRRAVLSVSWDVQGIRFASSGVDGCIRLWNVMCDQEVVEAIHARSSILVGNVVRGKPYNAEMPYFRSNGLHGAAIDYVIWLSDEVLLSKSRDHHEIVLWRPDFSKSNEQRQQVRLLTYPPARDVKVLRKFQLCGQEYSSRFSVDSLGKQLVVGEWNRILSWNLDEEDPNGDASFNDSYAAEKPALTWNIKNIPEGQIRVTCLAPDGRVLVACSDDGNLYRWSMMGH